MRAEKTRQLNSKKMAWVINPDSSGAIIWQLITSCCMCFVAVVTPIQVRNTPFLGGFHMFFVCFHMFLDVFS